MDRSEGTGLGIAILGHLLLFGALSLSLLATQDLPKIKEQPIEVALVDDVAIESAAPAASPAPAPAVEEPAPVVAAPPEPPVVKPEPPKPVPLPKVEPVPPPKPVAVKPLPKPAPAKPAPPKPLVKAAPPKPTKPAEKAVGPRRPFALPSDIAGNAQSESGKSQTTKPSPKADTGIRAQKTAAQWEASFIQSVLRKIQPYWKAPTGADAELLKTNLLIKLNRDGTIASVTVAGQTGATDSNQNLKALHAERAIKAVQRAHSFELPDELYDIWQTLGPITFDKKL
jgi:outer membrane biosynthesis protein TonB